MVQKTGYLKETPSQTAGPYVHIGMTPNFVDIHGVFDADLGRVMVNENTKGERITVCGRVIDGGGAVLRDAVIEVWQADADGFYNSPQESRGDADPDFTGWGRHPVDGTTGEFRFETVKPGRVPFRDGRLMAPHITLWIVARGINIGLSTRIYFSDEEAANAECPVLARIEHKGRIPTLLAQKTGPGAYRFDIRLQGPDETVFFDA